MRKYFLFTVCLMLSTIAFSQKGNNYKTITVQPKQTLFGIAREYNIPVNELKKCNEEYAPNYILKIGDKIKVPVGTSAQEKVSPPKTTPSNTEKTAAVPTKTPVQSDVKPSSTTYVTHIVKKGETLSSISRTNGIALKDLKALNGFTDNTNLSIGQKLKIKANTNSIASSKTAIATTTPKNEEVKTIEKAQATVSPQPAPTDTKVVVTEAPKPVEVIAPAKTIEKEQTSATTADVPTTNAETFPKENVKLVGGDMEHSYNATMNKNTKKTIRGIGCVAKAKELTNTSFVLYNHAEVGDVVKIVNLMSKKVAYLKVVGKVKEDDPNGENIIQISPETAKMMNTNETKFLVEVTGY